MKWISEQLVVLAKTFQVIVNAREIEERNRVLRPELNVFRFVGEMQNCSATEHSECGLASVLRNEHAYCKEFSIEKTKAGFGPTNRFVEVVVDNKQECPAPYSCPRCFYNQCILAFLDGLEYATVEMELPVGQSPVARLYLVGFIQKKPGSAFWKKVLLALKCTIDSKERMFLVAFKGTTVCYMEVILREGRNVASGYEYDIVQSSLLAGLNYDSKVCILPVDQIHFISEEGIIENFYSTNQKKIDDTFDIYYSQITIKAQHREVIRRKTFPKHRGDTVEGSSRSRSSGLGGMFTSIVDLVSLKLVVAVICACAVVLLLRESQRRRTSQKKRVPIL